MKCLVCGQAQPDAQAVSLLGCLLCHDCERLIVSVQPQQARITMQSSMLSVLAGQLIEETGLGTS